MWTSRRVFNHVEKHLLEQGVKSVGVGIRSTCLYRGVEGRKCAIGCLIKDEFYRIEMETYSATHPRVWRALKLSLELGVRIEGGEAEKIYSLLSTLQAVHDSEEVKDWKDKLHRVEVNYFGGRPERDE